ncbi:MAG: dCTP deaminase [Clostridia bacterium]|nr:dCTP deaminase [Clostridia bacterium]
MILTGNQIAKQVKNGKITISPFENSQVNPNSYNVELGDYLKVYCDDVLDSKKPLKTKIIQIPDDGIVLQPNKIYLGFTKEVVGSNYFVPTLTGRSSSGRLGLFVQITADLVDIGFKGNLTFQLHAVQPLKIYKGMKIGQVMFWKPMGKIKLYDGKYQNSKGPQESKVWQDFKKGESK